MTDQESIEQAWRTIADGSPHPEHWHYGSEDSDAWASITASDEGTIGAYNDGKWTVEYYNGEEPCERKREDTYPEMLVAVAEFMHQHEQSLTEEE